MTVRRRAVEWAGAELGNGDLSAERVEPRTGIGDPRPRLRPVGRGPLLRAGGVVMPLPTDRADQVARPIVERFGLLDDRVSPFPEEVETPASSIAPAR